MHKSATKCNETIGKWCKNKHGASKIIDTLETYHRAREEEDLGLFLLPNGRPGHRFIGAADDEATREISLGLFLLP
jgi:hypothetical protein